MWQYICVCLFFSLIFFIGLWKIDAVKMNQVSVECNKRWSCFYIETCIDTESIKILLNHAGVRRTLFNFQLNIFARSISSDIHDTRIRHSAAERERDVCVWKERKEVKALNEFPRIFAIDLHNVKLLLACAHKPSHLNLRVSVCNIIWLFSLMLGKPVRWLKSEMGRCWWLHLFLLPPRLPQWFGPVISILMFAWLSAISKLTLNAICNIQNMHESKWAALTIFVWKLYRISRVCLYACVCVCIRELARV